MSLFPCAVCRKKGKCHIESSFSKLMRQFSDFFLTFRFDCEYFQLSPGRTNVQTDLNTDEPCCTCEHNMNCQARRALCQILIKFTAASNVHFTCKQIAHTEQSSEKFVFLWREPNTNNIYHVKILGVIGEVYPCPWEPQIQ
jgi:hypothetical protein